MSILNTRQEYSRATFVAKSILGRISDGTYAPGQWLATQRELAVEFGVDRATVREALDHLTRDGIIVQRSGCRPYVNSGGVQQANDVQQGRIIAVVAVLGRYFSGVHGVLKGINREQRDTKSSCRIAVFDTQGDDRHNTAQREEDALLYLCEHGVSGVILWHEEGNASLELVLRMGCQGIPVVLIDRCPPGLACDFVGVDNAEAARDAVEYLVRLGHRRIAHATITDTASTVLDRRRGYEEAIAAFGLESRPELVAVLPESKNHEASVPISRLVDLPNPPTAIVAVNDTTAYRAIEELEAMGVRVPEHISVIGIDDLGRYSPISGVLTSVHVPYERIGRAAIRTIHERIAGSRAAGAPLKHILLPTTVIARSTCADITETSASAMPQVEAFEAPRLTVKVSPIKYSKTHK